MPVPVEEIRVGTVLESGLHTRRVVGMERRSEVVVIIGRADYPDVRLGVSIWEVDALAEWADRIVSQAGPSDREAKIAALVEAANRAVTRWTTGAIHEADINDAETISDEFGRLRAALAALSPTEQP